VHAIRRKRLLFLPLLLVVALGATSRGSWELIDRFKNVSVGEWVKLRYSRTSEHLLLVAAKDEETMTLEEMVKEQGYITSWMQIVVDLKKGLPVLARKRMPRGGIREIKIEGKESGLNEDFYAILTARFWEEPKTQRVVVPAGVFSCKSYHAVYNKKFIRIFFSNKIPLYPVKVVIPGYNLIIRLVAFGKGMESHFSPMQGVIPRQRSGEASAEESSPAAECPETGCRTERGT